MKAKIFLVTENIILGTQISTRLQGLGYEVIKPGKNGLIDELKEKLPTCMILDLKVQKHDALRAIEVIRADTGLQSLPILAFASENESRTLETARQLGANVVTTSTAMSKHLPLLMDQLFEIH